METIRIKDIEDLPKNFTGIVEWPNGDKTWFQDGEYHNTSGSAIIRSDGTKIWFQNDEYHRLDGPAIERKNKKNEHYIRGCFLTEKQFQIFQFIWENSTHERTEELMEIFIKLAKIN